MKYQRWLYARRMRIQVGEKHIDEVYVGEVGHMQLVEHRCNGGCGHQKCVQPQ